MQFSNLQKVVNYKLERLIYKFNRTTLIFNIIIVYNEIQHTHTIEIKMSLDRNIEL